MNAVEQTEYIVQCVRDSGAMYEADARAFLAEHDAHVRAATLAAARTEVVAWLVKKAHEHRAHGQQYVKQAELIGLLASKVDRGAVRIFGEPGAADTHQATRRRAMSDFLVLLRYSFGVEAVTKLLDDHPDLAELAARAETGDGS